MLEYADITTGNQRDEYRVLLDIVAASQSGKSYKDLRNQLRAHKAKKMTPTTEAEVLERLKGKTNGV